MTVTRDRQFHVLLVEDDECTLHVVERLLQNCGYAVTLARNGRQALEVLEGEAGKTVDLILTDLLMPEVSGLELVDGIIHNERYSGIPVVVMSSHDSQAAVMEAFEAGAKDFLIKPIRRNELTTLWQHVWRQNPGRLASQRAGPAARLGEGAAQRQAPSTAEPSGRTLASCNQAGQLLTQQPQQQQQGQQPVGWQGSNPGSQPQQQPVKAEQQQQQEPGAAARVVAGQVDRPSSAGGRSEEGLSTDASDTTTQHASVVAAWAGAAPREADPQLGPSGRLQGVLAAAAAAEHAAPPSSRGVDLDIAPLNLPPPPLFVTSKGVGSSGMPRGLAELAELGAKREVERAHSMDTAMAQALPMDDGPASSSLAALHHSSTSAFTHFTALVPPPCPRGGWGGAAVAAASVAQQAMQQQAQMAHPAQSVASPPMAPPSGCEPSASSRVQVASFQHVQQQAALSAMHPAAAAAAAAAWGTPGADLLHQQQQRFLQALQAAIQQHQAATRHMSADAQAHRRAAVEKFRQKRKQRSFEKKVRYESRKKLAEARPRIKGQFVKADVLLKQQQQQQMQLEQKQKEQQQGKGS